jgi:hypothetical protein
MPAELTELQNRFLISEYVKLNFVYKGICTDITRKITTFPNHIYTWERKDASNMLNFLTAERSMIEIDYADLRNEVKVAAQTRKTVYSLIRQEQ